MATNSEGDRKGKNKQKDRNKPNRDEVAQVLCEQARKNNIAQRMGGGQNLNNFELNPFSH